MRRLIIILCGFLPVGLMAQSFTWTGGTTNWGTPGNWTPAGGPPNGSGSSAIFSTTALPNPNLTAASVTVGSIQFSAVGGNTISATAPFTLTMQVSSGSSSISTTSSGNAISAPFTLASDLITTVSSNLTLTLSGIVAGASSLTAGGSGTTALTNAANTISGSIVASGGILQVVTGALGTATSVQITSGTFQAGATGVTTPATVVYTLSGVANFDSNGQTMIIQGPIHGTALTKINGGTLTLQGTSNDYTGGTTVSQGTLDIFHDGSLGAATGALSLVNNTILEAGASFNLGSSRPVSVTGVVTVNTNSFSPTISGPITGSGSLTVTGLAGNTLLLSGTNSYTGPTSVDTAILQGNTSSLQGAINPSATGTVIFSQAGSGTYGGVLTGLAGSILTIQGGGTYTFTGNSAASLSTTSIVGSHLILSGSLGASTLAIDATSSLGGTGTVATTGGISNQGQIIPGSSGAGTLTVSGSTTFNVGGGGTLVSQLTPLTNGLLQVSGTATLTNGILNIQPNLSGFFGLTRNYTLLTAGTRTGTFASYSVTDPKFSPSLSYSLTDVQLLLTILRPFLHFPFANGNERAVGENIDALNVAGLVSPDMSNIVNSLAGQSDAVINDALDQMHPAALSAFAELQTELGGQLLSLFHRSIGLACSCSGVSRFWVEPYGNWLKEKQQGMEIGFHATTRGVALGYDHQFFGCWTLGFGGAYQASDLEWELSRGYAYSRGAYGAFYTDLMIADFYIGASAYAGRDWMDTMRQIHFTTIDRQAKSNFHGFDAGGQLTTAYFFGTPASLLYPYATVDYLYLKNGSFKEREAASLDLNVESYTSSTLRAEAGGAWRFVDRNRDETICISPLISIGYVLEMPLHRDHYRARFSGEPLSFRTRGWDMAWQLLNLRFGLGITYRCFTLDSQYSADISPEGDSPFFNQRANFRLSSSF